MDQNHVRTTKRALHQIKRELTDDAILSADFSMEELESAIITIKPGKAAGLDGIYPEFIRNFGPKTKEWLLSFYNDIISTGKLPTIFKC
jgi:hypothetical protein